jgi:BASS family bile acid:Na+ symporter
MLGMGALLAPRDFVLEIRSPKGLIVGLCFQWLVVPVIALMLGRILPVPSGIALGLILIAAVPGGTLSNILTYLGRGNIALSISLTAITTVAALVTTPLLLQLMISGYLPDDFHMPTVRIARDIFVTLIVPLAMGMWMHASVSPVRSGQFSTWVIRLSLLLIVLMAIGAGGSGRLDPAAYGVMGIVALVIFAVVIKIISLGVIKAFRLHGRDGLAIVIEAMFRNMSLAVAIKAIVFPTQTAVADPVGDAVFFTVLLYGGVSLGMSLIPVFYHKYLVHK